MKMKYKPTIGIEVHVELKTKSKMFCSCKNDLGLEKKPNVNICPVCTAQPGSLPVINQEAVKMVLRAAKALHCQIPQNSKFDRKNYFYPDLPKAFQISQYDEPLSIGGHLEIEGEKIGITRIHLEEDTAKLCHPKGTDYSLVDFNRAGVPLMELVTEPDIHSAVQARKFCQELQIILRSLEVSDADMEKGQMRCEVNISLSGSNNLGTKVEIKNLNSFRAVERGIEYEIKRQTELLENEEKIIQETRGWDEKKQTTVSQRGKEEAHDYRYFPEMDLPPLETSALVEKLPALSELPQQKRDRLIKEYSLPKADVEVLVGNKQLADYFEQVVSELSQTEEVPKELPLKKLYKLTANYLITEIPRIAFALKEKDYLLSEKITPENFAELIVLTAKGDISSSATQTVLAKMFKIGADPTHIIRERDLGQVSDAKILEKIVEQAIKNNPQAKEDYKKGKENALQFLVGQVMEETKGKANPQAVREILAKKLSS